MTIYALVIGSLFRAPETRMPKAGKPFVTATIRTKPDDEFQFMNLISFSEPAQTELMCLDAGDAVSAQGPLIPTMRFLTAGSRTSKPSTLATALPTQALARTFRATFLLRCVFEC